MSIISTSLPADGETIDAADVNTPFNDILNVVNGNIDSDNVATGGLNYENFGTITGEIPASDMQDSGNVEKFRDEANVAFVASGCVWSTLSGLDGAMTAGVVYNANGVRNAPGAVASKTFTASRDTYVDIATNGSVSYSEVVNNNPAPALTANYVRIAKVVTSGAAITSITQSGYDSLSNLVYPSGAINAPSMGSQVTWWEEISRTTLTTAADTITVSGLPARKYLKVLFTGIATGGTIDTTLRLNNDSSSLYAFASFYNNAGTPATDSTVATSSITVEAFTGASGTVSFADLEIYNPSTHPKKVIGSVTSEQTSGAATAPAPYQLNAKYVSNTQVSRIDFINGGTGDYATGSEVIVLGHN